MPWHGGWRSPAPVRCLLDAPLHRFDGLLGAAEAVVDEVLDLLQDAEQRRLQLGKHLRDQEVARGLCPLVAEGHLACPLPGPTAGEDRLWRRRFLSGAADEKRQ